MSLASDFIDLLLPKLCVACETSLVRSENVICLKCRYDLPRTRFDSYSDNPVAHLFWGRVPIEYACSYFKYQNGSRFQSLIHNLKYRDRKDIGLELGRLMGIEIKDTVFSCADIIMPVPLHRKREIQRGYNQCDPICEGLSGVLDIPFSTQLLERSAGSSSQTSKSRFKRWENVEGIFRVKNPDALEGKHILLADDVVTTGSTLEACAGKILEVDGTRVSIATLAVALKSF